MMIEEVSQHLDQLLSAGIKENQNHFSPTTVYLYAKKNGKLRMCDDYEILNDRSIKGAYAYPHIEGVFDNLKCNKYFAIIGMKVGYHQEEIEEDHEERTAGKLDL